MAECTLCLSTLFLAVQIPFLAMHRKEAVYPLLRGRIEEYWNPLDVHYDEGLGKREDVEPHRSAFALFHLFQKQEKDDGAESD